MLMTEAVEQVETIRERNTVAESRRLLRLSNATFYARVKAGLLKITKDGNRSFVSRAELQRYLAACDQR
jgi:hypothetical protein